MLKALSRRATIAALMACALPSAQAEDLPALRIIVPTPPGGTNDGVARILQGPLQKLLGRTVLVEYKPGAASALGSAFVARSKPDGNTLLLNNNAVLINPLVSRGSGYEMADFSPLAVAAISPMLMIANAGIPPTDIKSLIAYANRQTEPLAYASAGGVGSLGHLAMESFAKSAGIKLLHVPYVGGAPAQTAVTSGEVKLVLTTLSGAIKGQVDAGRLRLLGVASARPSPLAPGVAPITDTVPGFVLDAWFGLLAPAQTPAAVLDRLSQALLQVLAMPEAQAQLTAIGVSPSAIGPAGFATMIAQEGKRWAEVVREQKITKE